MKCPKCNDDRVKLVPHDGIKVLVCGEGHFLAIDITEPLNSISIVVSALADTVEAQTMENRVALQNSMKALTDAISAKK